MTVSTVSFTSPDGLRLEGRLAVPDRPSGAAVICHPHPLFGGSMSSAMIPAIQRALLAKDWIALRFNFRGVGRSEGSYGGGIDEQRDTAAAIDRAVGDQDGLPVAVIGWSFGALVGLAAAAADERVGAYVGIAPPVTMSHRISLPPLPPEDQLGAWRRRALALCGTEDPYCRPNRLREWAAGIPGCEVSIFEGRDHFFTDALDELAGAVTSFVTEP